MTFTPDPAFHGGSQDLCELALCHVRLQGDARYPWLILIPRVIGARELEDLTQDEQARLMAEIVRAGAAVRAMGAAVGRTVEKLNVGQLGNITPQLHIHVVGRRADDEAWPGPVWGAGGARAYDRAALDQARAAALAVLAADI